RVKPQSMLTESIARHMEVLGSIHDRHRDLLEARHLTSIEHGYCPRFLWVPPDDTHAFTVFTDPASPIPFPHSQHGHWPPVLVIGSPEVREVLADIGALRGALLVIQAIAPSRPVSIAIETDPDRWGLAEQRKGPAHLVAFYSWHLEATAASPAFGANTDAAA